LKLAVWIAGILVGVGIIGYLALRFSPWPAALAIRLVYDYGGASTSRALRKHVPQGVTQQLDLRYDESDGDALLDVFYPASLEGTRRALPTVVWIHGGGWIAGGKSEVANYMRILAARGYTVAAVDYSLAPGNRYPKPVQQVNRALGYLVRNAARLHIDPSRLFLAGDSAGAQIAAQMANVVSSAEYARAVGIVPEIARAELRGVILHCGVYEVGRERYDELFSFRKAMVWAYAGSRSFGSDKSFEPFSVARYVTPAFPPALISAGNADPLLPSSVAFANALAKQRVLVDRLFFPADHQPALPHEYQFNLDTDAGREALERTVKFLSSF
jgi:acetyl esterase/lipase